MSVCFQIGVSIANQDYVCLLWGKAEVRVAPNDDKVIGLRNLVTERAVTERVWRSFCISILKKYYYGKF